MDKYFDKTEKYKNHIDRLVQELRVACNRQGMPMFVSVCVKNSPKETVYKNEMVSAVSSGIDLTDDKLVDFVNVINGFTTVIKETDYEDMADLFEPDIVS